MYIICTVSKRNVLCFILHTILLYSLDCVQLAWSLLVDYEYKIIIFVYVFTSKQRVIYLLGIQVLLVCFYQAISALGFVIGPVYVGLSSSYSNAPWHVGNTVFSFY